MSETMGTCSHSCACCSRVATLEAERTEYGAQLHALRTRNHYVEAFFPSETVIAELLAYSDFFSGTTTRPNPSPQRAEANAWLEMVRLESQRR